MGLYLRKKKGKNKMEFIKKEKAEFYSGDGYSGMDYPSTDKDINFAVIKINSYYISLMVMELCI